MAADAEKTAFTADQRAGHVDVEDGVASVGDAHLEAPAGLHDAVQLLAGELCGPYRRLGPVGGVDGVGAAGRVVSAGSFGCFGGLGCLGSFGGLGCLGKTGGAGNVESCRKEQRKKQGRKEQRLTERVSLHGSAGWLLFLNGSEEPNRIPPDRFFCFFGRLFRAVPPPPGSSSARFLLCPGFAAARFSAPSPGSAARLSPRPGGGQRSCGSGAGTAPERS